MLLNIVVTTGGAINYKTVSCLFDTIPQLPYDKFVSIYAGGYKQNSLTMAVNVAREHNATHMMFIDCDMIFPPDGIKSLIDQNKEVIGANYNEKHFPLISTAKLRNEKGEYLSGDVSQYKEPFKVAALGFGFLLVNVNIFHRIEKPYFNAPVDESDNFKTDDVYFCEKLAKVDIDIWCDPRIIVKHEGSYLY